MSCGLSYGALLVLEKLYRDHCFGKDKGYHCKKLERIISEKTDSKFDKIIKELLNERYITPINKKELKYYISDMPKAIHALNSHEYSVTQGRKRKL
jgi:hypothetical protein